MVASVTSPADVANIALARMGYRLRVGSLLDGSDAAGAMLDVYAQTRDTLMRDTDYQFCERNISAALLKAAPPGGYFPPNLWNPTTYPPPPWLYTYTYPSDALKVRIMKPQPLFPFNPDPQPNLFSIVNDNGYATPIRVVACNVPNAVMVYTGQIYDPAQWPVDFVEALAAALARRLTMRLIGQLQVEQIEASDEVMSTHMAKVEQG